MATLRRGFRGLTARVKHVRFRSWRLQRFVQSTARRPARIAVLSDDAIPERFAVLARQVGARPVVVSPRRDDVHLCLAVHRPFAMVIDACPADDGRLARFQAAFYHLRRGGAYVLAGGAAEAENTETGCLGAHLAELSLLGTSQAAKNRPPKLYPAVLDAIEVVGDDLVVVSAAANVVAELDGPRTAAYLAARPALGRVLETVEPASVSAPEFTEGPIRRRPATDRPMRQAAIELREYRGALAAPCQLVGTRQVLYSDSFRRSPDLSHRRVVPVAPGFGRPRVRWPAKPRVLEGTYLHLDDEYRGHFGHVLTETAGRVWSWPKALELDPDVRVLISASRKRPTIAAWEAELYETWGIPRDRFVIIDGPVKVDRLIAGTSLFSNLDFVHPLIVEAWDRAGDGLAGRAADRDRPERIFVSRHEQKRGCRNTEDVEALFEEHGFAVVYPEEWPLPEQVAMFRRAEVIAGYGGSGLFHMALVKTPKRVIVLNHSRYRTRNEYFMAAVRGHRLDAVISEPDTASFQSDFVFDMSREGVYLQGILDAL